MAFLATVNNRQIIGWNLRRLRVARGLSQERLAFEAGIDRSYVGRIERGTENVTLDALEKFAGALGVTVRDLFDSADEPGAARPRLRAGRKAKAS